MQIIRASFLAVATMVAAPGDTAPYRQDAWFYATSAGHRWCGVTKRKDAEAVAADQAFAGEETAWLRYGAKGIETVVFATTSQDAAVDDTYRFAPDGTVLSVQRKGHYIENPVFSVVYARDKAGHLRLTPQSRKVVALQIRQRHETYFLDWRIYRSFQQFPFARLVATKPGFAVTRRCPVPPRQGR